jgi:DNA-binding NtrC family response regulator
MSSSSDSLISEETSAQLESINLLLVEDEQLFAKTVQKRLQREGYECRVAETLHAADVLLSEALPDLVLLDIKLPDGNGLEFLAQLRERYGEELPVVMMTAFGDMQSAVEAMRLKALDYLKKPVDLDELVLFLARVTRDCELQRASRNAQVRQAFASSGIELVGSSPTMRALVNQLQQIGRIGSVGGEPPPTVMIEGETGTGKDLTARLLHAMSARRDRPFVHVDCASLPKDLIEAELFGHEKGSFTNAHAARTGLIEAAEDGTLFLDEIGEISLQLQGKLLAVLERRRLRRVGSSREHPTEAWFIAATNRSLEAMVAAGEFRADLYYRLNVLTVSAPPLRARGDDVVELAHNFVTKTAQKYGLQPPALSREMVNQLKSYTWPGNVRELKHVIERAVLLNQSGTLAPEELGTPSTPRSGESRGEALDGLTLMEAERYLIERALQRADGNVSRAARELGVTRMVLRYRIDKHQLGGCERAE